MKMKIVEYNTIERKFEAVNKDQWIAINHD